MGQCAACHAECPDAVIVPIPKQQRVNVFGHRFTAPEGGMNLELQGQWSLTSRDFDVVDLAHGKKRPNPTGGAPSAEDILLMKVKGNFVKLKDRRVLFDWDNKPVWVMEEPFFQLADSHRFYVGERNSGAGEATDPSSITATRKLFSIHSSGCGTYEYGHVTDPHTGKTTSIWCYSDPADDKCCLFMGNKDPLSIGADLMNEHPSFNRDCWCIATFSVSDDGDSPRAGGGMTGVDGTQVYDVQVAPGADYALVISMIMRLNVNETEKNAQGRRVGKKYGA